MWTIAATFGAGIAFVVCVALREARRMRAARRQLVDETATMSDAEFEAELCLPVGASQNVGRTVREILARQLDIPQGVIHPDTILADLFKTKFDGGDPVGVVMALEERFQIAIPDRRGNDLRTVRMLISYVAQTIEQRGTEPT